MVQTLDFMSKKILIFEGPDGAGKSTIAKALSEVAKIPLMAATTAPHDPGLQNDDRFLMNLVWGETKLFDFFKSAYGSYLETPIIRDRSFFSEYVYSKVFGRTTCMKTIEMLAKGYYEAKEFEALTFVCMRDDKKYKTEAEEFSSVNSNLEKIHNGYMNLVVNSNLPGRFFKLNTMDENLSRQLKYIMQVARL